MAEPAAVAKAQADLQEFAQLVALWAPLVPQFAAYASALVIALELMSAAVGTIKPESPEQIEEAEKLNPLGMG